MRPVFVLRTGTEFRVDIAILSLHENAEKIKSAAVFFTEKSQKSLLRPPSCKKQPSRSTLRNSLAVQDSVDRLHAGGVFHRHRTANIYAHVIAEAEAKADQTFDRFGDLIAPKGQSTPKQKKAAGI